MKTLRSILIIAFIAITLTNCGSTSSILSTPIENIDTIPLKVSELTENEKKYWSHLDLVKDTVPGMSINKAYSEIIKNKKGKPVIVAVIDQGIDIDHEDLDAIIWTNKGEIPNNGKDDDKNGYVDDIHGWNFLGDGHYEQLELTRILASGDTNNVDFERAQAEYNEEYERYSGLQKQYLELKTNYDQFLKQLNYADEAISKKLGTKNYTQEDVEAIKTEDQSLLQAIAIIDYVYSLGTGSVAETKEQINSDLKGINRNLEQFNMQVNYYLNKSFNGRVTGDNPDDMSTKFYGNGNIKPVEKTELHGTFVAGIIAAERNNGLGANGVANNVQIMSIRALPQGDEYDKDVALAIRYAADNGAQVINTSFGKGYSPHSDWVRDAIAYAGKKDVLIVNAAGNDAIDIDKKPTFPNDAVGVGAEVSDTFVTVGALNLKYGTNMVADYSNYGKINVDVFAPGSQIYATTPENEYEFFNGTSFAAPGVAGVAALIRSYYPKLSAAQVKQILMNSGVPIKTKVMVGGDSEDIRPFDSLSKSPKIVNAYNALIMASQISN